MNEEPFFFIMLLNNNMQEIKHHGVCSYSKIINKGVVWLDTKWKDVTTRKLYCSNFTVL